MQRISIPLMVIVAVWMCGCSMLPHSSGLDPHWGRRARITKQGSAYSHHITGVVHERRGELEDAAAAYNAVVELDRQAVTPRLRLLRVQLRQGVYEEALATCKVALEQIPDSPELWIAYGELNYNQGNIEDAVAAVERAIELRPDDLVGYGALLELQEKTNDLVAAIEIYERLIEKSPDSAALYYQLGINLTRIGDYAGAREVFERVLTLEPRVTRARFLLALVFYELEQFEQCAEQLRLYLLERPDDITAAEYHAGALYRLGRVEQARRVFERLVARGEVSAKTYLQLAWILFQQGDMDRAQQFALEGGAYFYADIIFALALMDGPEREHWTANPWDDRYTFEEIDQECDLILSALPALLGKSAMGDVFLAKLDALRENIGFSPILEFFCARLLLHSENYVEALAHLDALRLRGVNSRYIHYHSAVGSEKLDNFSDAEYHLRAFLEMDPDNADVLNFLGYLYAEHNTNLEEAEGLLQRALAIDPENPYYLDSLGWIYYRQGKAEEAARLIRSAIYGMDNDDAVLRDHLGDIYLLLDNKDKALAEWRRAIRLDPDMDAVQEKIEQYAPSD